MRLRDDLETEWVVPLHEVPWMASPSGGVERRMLERVGDEVARATSVVRYRPGSAFPTHTHHGGEEFVVLDGTFVDEHGRYPAGTYVRNAVGSSHAPSAPDGCTILVKLWQMDAASPTVAVRDVFAATQRRELHRAGDVVVAMQPLPAGHEQTVESWEALVLQGTGMLGEKSFEAMTWLRAPPRGATLSIAIPALLWTKCGALGAEPGAPALVAPP